MSTNTSNKSNKRRRPNVERRRSTSSTARCTPTSQASAADTPSSNASKKKKPRNFSNVEDQMLCRAFVNTSSNPIVGANQKGKVFWATVKSKFDHLFFCSEEDDKDSPREERREEALQTRFLKKIQPEMNHYNPFYKRIAECTPTGTPNEDWPRLAAIEFLNAQGKEFKFLHCVEILHQMPKFNPVKDDDDEIDLTQEPSDDDDVGGKPRARPSINKIGKPMGSGIDSAMGQEQAKRMVEEEASVASLESAKVRALRKMSEAHNRVASSIEASNKLEALKSEYMILKDMGDMVGCAGVLTELRAMKNPPASSPTATAETSPTNASSVAAPSS
jgi:hypothetical protein